MSGASLYDEDILLWSEQQAALIRRLGAPRRKLPNQLDVENVAEEIESVGRSELASVESYIELILLHLIKLSAGGDTELARHWRGEIVAFHGNMRRRYTPSMRQRIDLDEVWRLVRRQVVAASDQPGRAEAELPATCPFSLDELLERDIDSESLQQRLRVAGQGDHTDRGEPR